MLREQKAMVQKSTGAKKTKADDESPAEDNE
jgi:hypothetical protein